MMNSQAPGLTWQEVPHLDALLFDALSWVPSEILGEYFESPLDINHEDISEAQLSMLRAGDWVRVQYHHANGDPNYPVECTIEIRRRAHRLGLPRNWFVCPKCGHSVRRLVLRPYGLRCGRCANVRSTDADLSRLKVTLRELQQVSDRLQSPNWRDLPRRRPPRMHQKTYRRLRQRRAILVAEVNCISNSSFEGVEAGTA